MRHVADAFRAARFARPLFNHLEALERALDSRTRMSRSRTIEHAVNSQRSRTFRLITRADHEARTVVALSPVLFSRYERDATIREIRSLSERVEPLLLGAAILADMTGQFHPGMTQDPDSWIAAGQAIAGDWEAVAGDLTAAAEQFSREHLAGQGPPAA